MTKAGNSQMTRTITLLITIFSLSLTAYAKYSGGTGEPNYPYQIATAEDLILLGDSPEDYDKHFIMTADIDLDPNLPGGKVFDLAVISEFSGTFDGNGLTISHLTIIGGSYLGLFGQLASGAEVSGLGIANVNITSSGWGIGGLAGCNQGTITNSYAAGTIRSNGESVGGLVGWNSGGDVTGCYSVGTVSGKADWDGGVGGLVGDNDNGNITESYSTATVKGDYAVGGLVGENNFGSISKCQSFGSVAGGSCAGGLVGLNSSYGRISVSYSTGEVRGNRYVGGLVGNNDDGGITTSYSNSTVIGMGSDVGGLVGENDRGGISASYSTGMVKGNGDVGGLVGSNYQGSITTSYSTGTASGEDHIGGLVGWNRDGYISNCYSMGTVNGDDEVGGLVGINYGSITASYSTSTVSGGGAVGGLVGYNEIESVVHGVWDTETSGQATSAGGTGLTTTEMQIAATFGGTGWGCNPTWTIDEGNDYPRLWWEDRPGKPIDSQLSLFLEGKGTQENPYIIYTLEDIDIVASFLCEQNTQFSLGFLSGEGTKDSPYLIDTADALDLLGKCPYELDKYFKLIANIDLSGYSYDRAVIAPDTNDERGNFQGTTFTGVFDATGHTISNLTIVGDNYLGLFGLIGSEANIYNLGLEAVDINGTGEYVGGLVGYNNLGIVSNCYSVGMVSGEEKVGGLVGLNDKGIITRSYSSVTVSGNRCIGGLVGSNGDRRRDGGLLNNCYSTGAVSGGSRVGGLVGWNLGEIAMSYSTSTVSGRVAVGGLLGQNYEGDITSSFWDTQTSDQTWSSAGYGKTTAEMQTASTFLEAGWDFVDEAENGTENIWWIDEGKDYPRLWWETAEQ